jgi:hypothetical protein
MIDLVAVAAYGLEVGICVVLWVAVNVVDLHPLFVAMLTISTRMIISFEYSGANGLLPLSTLHESLIILRSPSQFVT